MIEEYPLIAVTEVFDMPSVDNAVRIGYGGGKTELGPTSDIIENKLADVLGDYTWRDRETPLDCREDGYAWGYDTKIEYPIHIVTWEGPTTDTYGHEYNIDVPNGTRIMGNGHHRLAYEALVQGALFVHYTDDRGESTDKY